MPCRRRRRTGLGRLKPLGRDPPGRRGGAVAVFITHTDTLLLGPPPQSPPRWARGHGQRRKGARLERWRRAGCLAMRRGTAAPAAAPGGQGSPSSSSPR